MIAAALEIIVGVLNRSFDVAEDEEQIALVAEPSIADGAAIGDPRLRLSLLKADREVSSSTLRKAEPPALSEFRPAPLRLNLDVMLSTSGENYGQRLALLERAMRALHNAKSVEIVRLEEPEVSLARVQIELQTRDLQTTSQIWSAFQGRLGPHAVYRLRGVILEDAEATLDVTLIKVINIATKAPVEKDETKEIPFKVNWRAIVEMGNRPPDLKEKPSLPTD